jgi:DNA excision repair protein ERCC-2
METIYAAFKAESPETDTIIQLPGMTENERDHFLMRFAEENPNTLVGFAVMGGIFGEGIDLVGDRLSGAVIVGVGLPAISPQRELIREYFEKTDQSGFDYAYLYAGINRVLQAAGRVIRSESDQGMVLLIDKRFSWSQYASLFPGGWRPVHVKDGDQVRDILTKFWK